MDKYKKTSLNFAKDVEKRRLRTYRRSVDRSNIKHIRLSALRHIDPVIEESLEESVEVPVTKTETVNKVSSKDKTVKQSNKGSARFEMLTKWKEEKELRKRLEMQKSKPAFVISRTFKPPPSAAPLKPAVNKNKDYSRIIPPQNSSVLKSRIVPPKNNIKQNIQPKGHLPVQSFGSAGQKILPHFQSALSQTASNLPQMKSGIAQVKKDLPRAQKFVPQVQRNGTQVKNALVKPQGSSLHVAQRNISNAPKVNSFKAGSHTAPTNKFTAPTNKLSAPASKFTAARGNVTLQAPKNVSATTSHKTPVTPDAEVPQRQDELKEKNENKSFAPSNFVFAPQLNLQKIVFQSYLPSRTEKSIEKSFRWTPSKLKWTPARSVKEPPKINSIKEENSVLSISEKLTSSYVSSAKVQMKSEDEEKSSILQHATENADSAGTPSSSLKYSREGKLADETVSEQKGDEIESKDSSTNVLDKLQLEEIEAKDLSSVNFKSKNSSVTEESSNVKERSFTPEISDITSNDRSKHNEVPAAISPLTSPEIARTPRRSKRLASLQKQIESLSIERKPSPCRKFQTSEAATPTSDLTQKSLNGDLSDIAYQKISQEHSGNADVSENVKKFSTKDAVKKNLRPRCSAAVKENVLHNLDPISEDNEAQIGYQLRNNFLDSPKPLTRQQRKISLLGSPQVPCHGYRKSVKGDLITFSPVT